MLKAFCDADDLWTRQQLDDLITPIHEAVPTFKICLYSIPNKLGPVHELKQEFPYVTFGIHGWEHVPFECRAWTEDDAERHITKALEMGYAQVFKAPNWTFDEELVKACARLRVVLHHHPDNTMQGYKFLPQLYPAPKQWRSHDHVNFHTHITPNPVTDWIGDHPAFRPERLAQVDEFLTIEDVAI